MEISRDILCSIMDDTVGMGLRVPKVGDKLRSWADTIEIKAVEGPLKNPDTGAQDYLVNFNVIEVHSPEDSSLDFDEQLILYGDLVTDDAYQFLDDTIHLVQFVEPDHEPLAFKSREDAEQHFRDNCENVVFDGREVKTWRNLPNKSGEGFTPNYRWIASIIPIKVM